LLVVCATIAPSATVGSASVGGAVTAVLASLPLAAATTSFAGATAGADGATAATPPIAVVSVVEELLAGAAAVARFATAA
jgi:hypothetical protein